jgi:hypothetical protein
VKRSAVFIILFLSSNILFPQTETFEKLYDSGTGYAVKEAADGGYVIGSIDSGYVEILKTDANGNLLWKSDHHLKQYTTASFDFADDGGILYTGYVIEGDSDIGLVKLDKDGNFLWKKTFGSPDTKEVGLAITKTFDGNFVLLAGKSKATVQNILNFAILIKVDNNGDTLWVKSDFQIIELGSASNGHRIVELSDSSLAVLLHYNLMKFSTSGKMLWDLNLSPQFYLGLCEGSDANIYVSRLFTVTKYLSSGSFVKSKSWTDLRGENIATSFTPNEYLVSNNNALVVMNDNLDSLEQHTFFGKIFSIAKTKDHHYLLTGTNRTNKLWFVKTDQNFSYRSISVLTPEIKSKHRWGDSLLITWQSSTSGNVKIEFSSDSGSSWQIIASSVIDNNKYNWVPLTVVSKQCKIKVSDAKYPSLFSESEVFTIHPNMNSDTLSINNILMWFQNDGHSAHNPRTDGAGLYWPKGSGNSAIYQDGFIWSGKVNGEIRANGSAYRTGTTPGNILSSGNAADPFDINFGIWKMRRDDSQLSPVQKELNTFNYQNWPRDLGAPFANGNPYSLGDETAFFVTNDLDTMQSNFFAGSNPIGLEIKHTIYGYKSDGFLGDVLFKNFKIINKSNYTVDSMYIGLWSDGDLGNVFDDYFGCDSLLNLAYFYNSDDDDEGYYGIAPPTAGYMVVRGVVEKGNINDSVMVDGNWKRGYKDFGMTTFIPIIKSPFTGPDDGFPQGTYQCSKELYNLMSGRTNDGSLFLGIKSGLPLGHYPFGGDPETGTGMIEGPNSDVPIKPDDRRLALSSGPFTFAPGDTQIVTIAVLLARGSSNLNSVTKLKETSKLVTSFYNQYLTDVEKEGRVIPKQFELYQNYPNPFNPETVISYQLAENSKVSLKVYDILGKEMVTLVNEVEQPGFYEIVFNANRLASGVYFYQLRAGQFVQTKKFVVLK